MKGLVGNALAPQTGKRSLTALQPRNAGIFKLPDLIFSPNNMKSAQRRI